MGKRLFEADEWGVSENHLYHEHMRVSESIMSLANGHMGIRGNFEEKYSGDSLRGTYLAGVWYPDKTRVGWWKVGYPDYFGKIINSINFIGIKLNLDAHEVDLGLDKIHEYSRKLNMKKGLLNRHFIVKTPSGLIEVITQRFLSISRPEIAAVTYLARCLDNDGTIAMSPYLDGNIKNEGANYNETFWEELSRTSDYTHSRLLMRTRPNPFGAPQFTVCSDMICATIGDVTQKELLIEDSLCGVRFTFSAKKNKWVGVVKYIAVTTSRDYDDSVIEAAASSLVKKAALNGYKKLKTEHSRAWNKRWEKADINISGDMGAQQGIRFNIFQLLSTYYGGDARLNIGPKGFTGEKYGGAAYWDTEAFLFPVYLAIADSSIARNLLLYRFSHLEAARDNAKHLGLKGALYPMVTFTGAECHNEWEITFEEIHRNGAVAFAIFEYVSYTKDETYLYEYGIDVLTEISKFWASRVHFSKRAGKYMIHGVTGPNEYENNVNNNWYTNRMASWCLEYTLYVLNILREKGLSDKIARLGITREEEALWKDIYENMYLPYDEELKVFVQHDTFLDKELSSADSIPYNERPINQYWSWDRILRSCYLKQADVLQGLYFLGHKYSNEEKKRNFLFYEPMTVHESSLSPCIHSILAAELGMKDKAVEMYKRTARLDLDNINNDTSDGLHITSMGGSWLAIVQGFAGMRTIDGLSFKPFLPDKWNSYSFKVNYRGRLLKVFAGNGKTIITLEKGKPLEVTIYEYKQRLADYLEAPLPGRYRAVVFDLDGVVVDTANYHYLAWKKLADELGIDFNREENKLFKGVGRKQCMDLLLSFNGLSMTEEEKARLSERKNNYYIEYISKMTKDEISEGFLNLCKEIKQLGWRTALASSSKNTSIVLDRLELWNCFDTILDGNDIINSKPNPEIFEKAAHRMGISPWECIVFEDAQAGVEAAKAAGMRCIGIDNKGELDDCDLIIPGFKNITIKDILEGIEGDNI